MYSKSMQPFRGYWLFFEEVKKPAQRTSTWSLKTKWYNAINYVNNLYVPTIICYFMIDLRFRNHLSVPRVFGLNHVSIFLNEVLPLLITYKWLNTNIYSFNCVVIYWIYYILIFLAQRIYFVTFIFYLN